MADFIGFLRRDGTLIDNQSHNSVGRHRTLKQDGTEAGQPSDFCGDSLVVEQRLQSAGGGSSPTSSLSVKDLKVTECKLSAIREFVEQHHYSHSVNGVKISLCFMVELGPKLVGAVIFGGMSTTAWKKFARTEQAVLELRRLVFLDEAPKNSESRVIGVCLRHIRKHIPGVEIVVSYADPAHGHTGVVYKASGFVLVGMSGRDQGFRDENGRIYHSRALRTKYKGDYKPFVKVLRQKLASGLLVPVEIPPKFCYTFSLRTRGAIGETQQI